VKSTKQQEEGETFEMRGMEYSRCDSICQPGPMKAPISEI